MSDLKVCPNCGELLRDGRHDSGQIECDAEKAQRYNHQPVYDGYTQRQLHDAFDLVKNKSNWKLHINALVPNDVDRRLIEAACIYFAGSPPTFMREGKRLRVTAAGYYACIGS